MQRESVGWRQQSNVSPQNASTKLPGEHDGTDGSELESTAGGGFIDAADLGDGGDGDGFGGVAEGGDDALLLGGEAGEEVAEDELEGIIARRATAQVGEGVGDGGAVAAADLPGGPGEEQGVAAGLVDEAEAVGLGAASRAGLPQAMSARVWRAEVWSSCWSLSRLPVAMTRGRLVRRALQVRGR